MLILMIRIPGLTPMLTRAAMALMAARQVLLETPDSPWPPSKPILVWAGRVSTHRRGALTTPQNNPPPTLPPPPNPTGEWDPTHLPFFPKAPRKQPTPSPPRHKRTLS